MAKKIYQPKSIPSSEITPEHLYLRRREFLKLGALASAAAVLAACSPSSQPSQGDTPQPAQSNSGTNIAPEDPVTSYEAITTYNNYYEFSLDKEDVASLAQKLTTSPWTVDVGGLVNKPQTFNIEDILKKFPQEERIYRMRCVEGWSMVIPWSGFPLSELLKQVEPQGDAKYVRFTTLARPEEMPGLESPFFPWPYQEGLRLDEAMHNLTIIATGLYGKSLPNQNGAPLRIVVPWKYGFKSAKSIVKIELTAEQPATFWNTAAPNEYGFYSNVNPERRHPRWSQATERRIGETTRRPTLMLNGYAEEVASLYAGMDLIEYY